MFECMTSPLGITAIYREFLGDIGLEYMGLDILSICQSKICPKKPKYDLNFWMEYAMIAMMGTTQQALNAI